MDILDLFFKSNPYFASQHHLDSYNEFVDITIKKVIASMNPFPIVKQNDNIEVYIGGKSTSDIYITTPKHLPNICRIKNLTYESELRADIHVYNNGEESFIQKDVLLCKIPIMVHSNKCFLHNMNHKQLVEAGECPFDKGGYFIVNGKEKVIISQDRNIDNKLFVSKPQNKAKYELQGYIKCVPEGTSVFPKTLWMYQTVPMTKDSNDWCIKVAIPHIAEPINLFHVMRILGVETDKQIVDLIGEEYAAELRPTIVHAHKKENMLTQEDTINYYSKLTKFANKDNLLYVLYEDFLPNVPYSLVHKANYLAYLTRKFLNVITKKEEIEDRDSHINKRIGISGFLLGDIFKDFYNDFRVQTRTKIDRIYNIDGKITEDSTRKFDFFSQSPKFQTGLIKSLKGNWGLLNDSSQQGIVQDLNRLSYMGFLSHLRRVNTPLGATVKVRKPHQLDCTQWGIMCPCESPDGASIGLLRNLAMLCYISSSSDYTDIIKYVKKFDVFNYIDFDELTIRDIKRTKFILNNNWIACCSEPHVLYNYLRVLKRCGVIDKMTSVTWNYRDNVILVHTDAGRCCRPLLVVQKGKVLLRGLEEKQQRTWDELVTGSESKTTITGLIDSTNISKTIQVLNKVAGVIEYLDVEEVNHANIGMTEKDDLSYKTHIEIHPSTIFSIYTSTIPFSNHNQAPRNIFSGAQGKQALGIYATNFNNRIDTASYILHYPQRPLVSTSTSKYFHANELTNGENLIVAIMTYTGYNQEDSIIINRSSIERGMFNITSYKSHVEQVSNNLFFGDPKKYRISRNRYGNYKHIDENGFPIVNHKLELDDCIVGRMSKNIIGDSGLQSTVIEYDNISSICDRTLDGYTIDKVYRIDNDNVKLRLRKMKIPELGDKASSRHGQKGVFGMVLPEYDMPWASSDGVKPDIIVNPHAFPSRMTIGHILECVFAKVTSVTGTIQDYEHFEVPPVEQFNKLGNYGLCKTGDEILYNGFTGEQIETEIFIGPTYYYRLKHMVSDKINYRGVGKVVGVTKQPPKGRSNGGGLRIGEMETNVLVSYGISGFTKESLMKRSDETRVKVDNKRMNSSVYVPHAYKLLTQELKAMSIDSEWILDEEKEVELFEDERYDDSGSDGDGDGDGDE